MSEGLGQIQELLRFHDHGILVSKLAAQWGMMPPSRLRRVVLYQWALQQSTSLGWVCSLTD